MANKGKHLSLKDYLETLEAEGRHWFTVEELQKTVSLKEASLRVALSRYAKAGHVKIIRRGFGIILPAHGNELHPSFYVDAMMKHLGATYYVGLLSAAAYWGASHQASMVYQIVANKVVAPIQFEHGRLEFVAKRDFPQKWIKKVAAIGGYINVSSPELTTIDLIRFPKKSGRLNNVATIISELKDKWDKRTMNSIYRDSTTPTVTLQRLGFILEILGFSNEASSVELALRSRRLTRKPLSQTANLRRENVPFNSKWSLYVNTQVEPD